ncbi:MAG: hypothetical protein K8W52_23015 [Deltaproteobacteria bacterium]|nr:hypothetical protein [Deltaproteobacteria bacterium]
MNARITLTLAIASALSSGCLCGYGGPGCDDPWAIGLCAPRIAVGTPVTIEIDYGDDTGLHPAEVSAARTGDTATALAALGPDPATVVLLGRAPGVTPVELRVAGWDEPVWFSLEVEHAPPPDACAPDLERPGFAITGRGPTAPRPAR